MVVTSGEEIEIVNGDLSILFGCLKKSESLCIYFGD